MLTRHTSDIWIFQYHSWIPLSTQLLAQLVHVSLMVLKYQCPVHRLCHTHHSPTQLQTPKEPINVINYYYTLCDRGFPRRENPYSATCMLVELMFERPSRARINLSAIGSKSC